MERIDLRSGKIVVYTIDIQCFTVFINVIDTFIIVFLLRIYN